MQKSISVKRKIDHQTYNAKGSLLDNTSIGSLHANFKNTMFVLKFKVALNMQDKVYSGTLKDFIIPTE